ncbi:hypothetical protein MOJ79_07715 [Calidifontimicrobium sp. SYSU G02091]|uniref:hypothetical protein n=1 Tax=Calidifontimicrobium sp. SYSU G02091 TaxID=2926421 RepID=UPI001F52C170|nr:hypothetical protein [Calidifontimicrobium sp. SYSU G02091]MCI1191726.1 hypothetical protein [Calidifontimicrobium sp. SYSU G02091]
MAHRTIPIHPAGTAPTVLPPTLVGEPGRVRGLLSALERAVCGEVGRALPAGAWLRELRVDDDEAVVALAPAVGRPEVVQVAFETLRRLLRDTDIYVGAARH